MVNYKMQKSNDLFEVLETVTGNIIKSALTNNQAKDLCRHLNLGGGFNGETPAFFLKNIPYEVTTLYK